MQSDRMIDPKQLENVIRDAKTVAKRYRCLTGRPLGITGEIAEYEAARLLNLVLTPPRQDGHDAIRVRGKNKQKLQIKGRCILDQGKRGQRVGSIKLQKEWDGVLLVLLDQDFEPLEIYEADRPEIEAALKKPGSRSRTERGALAVSQFKSIGRLMWSRPN